MSENLGSLRYNEFQYKSTLYSHHKGYCVCIVNIVYYMRASVTKASNGRGGVVNVFCLLA